MNQTMILGVLRHLLQLGAGFAVARGWWADSDTETIIGAALSVATLIWYLVERRSAKEQATVAQAVQAQGAVLQEALTTVQVAAAASPSPALADAAERIAPVRRALDAATSIAAKVGRP